MVLLGHVKCAPLLGMQVLAFVMALALVWRALASPLRTSCPWPTSSWCPAAPRLAPHPRPGAAPVALLHLVLSARLAPEIRTCSRSALELGCCLLSCSHWSLRKLLVDLGGWTFWTRPSSWPEVWLRADAVCSAPLVRGPWAALCFLFSDAWLQVVLCAWWGLQCGPRAAPWRQTASSPSAGSPGVHLPGRTPYPGVGHLVLLVRSLSVGWLGALGKASCPLLSSLPACPCKASSPGCLLTSTYLRNSSPPH